MNAARFALLACAWFVGVAPLHAAVVEPFISEVHYDNAGSDVGEFVAVTGPRGLDLSGWEIALYNGSNGSVYDVLPLTGQLPGESGELFEAYWPATGLQNGPDAVALVTQFGVVVDFIAYEQAVKATDGAAAGATARLLPVAEGGSTAAGESLQRVGGLHEWSWIAATASPGVVNPGLRPPSIEAALPLPTVIGLWSIGLVGWLGMRGCG